jgi:hypothetical protein
MTLRECHNSRGLVRQDDEVNQFLSKRKRIRSANSFFPGAALLAFCRVRV